MTQIEVSKRLSTADQYLSDAIETLVTLPSSAQLGQDALGRVQAALEGMDAMAIPSADRARKAQMLRRLETNAGLAKKLLESAATLYFGGILSHGFVSSEYLPDGESSSFGGGCLRTEG